MLPNLDHYLQAFRSLNVNRTGVRAEVETLERVGPALSPAMIRR